MAYWDGRRVVVTGAGGFIGSHLTERLVRAGAKVRAVVHYNSRNDWGHIELLDKDLRDSVEVVCGDVRDPFFCRQALAGQQVVMHLAALIGIPYSYVAPADYVYTNVVGTLNVLQAARELDVEKMVHTSTSETYGTARYVPIDEEHPLQAQSPYSASKIGADKMAESYFRSFGTPVATIRPFNTYGPRQSARAVIPTIISQLVAGARQVRLGSLAPVRDLTYVLDTAAGFMAVAQSDKTCGQTINVGAGKGISIGELAEMIIEIMGVSAEIVCDQRRLRPEPSEVMRLIASNTKARELAEWEPSVSLRQGLAETVEFVRRHIDLYKSDLYNL